MLLTAHGDSKTPLPETIKVLDEIATEFIQGLAFEATRLAYHAGRQKVKFEDFQFAMRRNPDLLGKVHEMMDKKVELAAARRAFDTNDTEAVAGEAAAAAAATAGIGGPGGRKVGGAKDKDRDKDWAASPSFVGGKRTRKEKEAAEEEELGDGDDDDEIVSAVAGGVIGDGKRRKVAAATTTTATTTQN